MRTSTEGERVLFFQIVLVHGRAQMILRGTALDNHALFTKPRCLERMQITLPGRLRRLCEVGRTVHSLRLGAE